MPRSRRIVLLSVILLLALAVRLVGLQFGLPFAYARPDETEAAGPAVTYILTGSLRPQFFQWPSLFSYIVAGLYTLYGGVFGFLTGHASVAAFAESRYRWFAPFLLIPRGFSVFAGVMTVAAVYALGRRVFDDAVGLVAALFLALAFLHVRDSHFGMSDVTMTLLVVLAVRAAIGWQRRGGVIPAAWAGLLVGLAGSTKYNGLAAGAAFVAAAGVRVAYDIAPLRATVNSAVAFAAGVAAGFFGASPYILVEWARFVSDISTVQDTMASGHGGLQLGRGWIYFGTTILPVAVGWPVFIASLAGIAGLLRRPRLSATLLAFPIAYYLYAGQSYSVFARYMEPVLPFLCLTAAWMVVTLGRSIAADRSETARGFAIAALALLFVAPSAWAVFELDRLLSKTDNRVVVANALAGLLPADDLVYQSGSSYGRVPLGIDDHGGRGAELREVTFNEATGGFEPSEPDWILVQRSPLTMYSRVPDSLSRVLADRFTRVATFPVDATPEVPRLYDQQDAFYLPLAGFDGLRRPGPSFDLYRPDR